uniref:Notoamide biosynthesis cluster transcriptional coactivator notQ' n=1 Tax=Aspergillus versicolor TaxID=46472 RepID=NOTQ_ASPVE|nr:RecName: Full=Notoamide biosynthesis cluster transcriptional coactivator notQ'; AltName: Full=Notoamide biosynthesis cluster protein Q' [Aspergillus versicolor]AGC83588.1 transcription factor [Aspergillus versicolor]
MPPESERKLACLVCRHRKVACDRGRPQCGLCRKNGFDCEYKTREHRPGLRAGYVSQLEKRVEDLERQMEDVLGRLSQSQPSQPATERDDLATTPSTGRLAPPLCVQNVESTNSPQADTAPVETTALTYELQLVWLQKYQPWFPIMHHTSAVKAVAIWDSPGIPWERKQFLSERLRQEVIVNAMGSLHLRTVQALLTLSILFWGEGKWVQYSNLAAMCKRLSQQLGLPTVAGVAAAQPSKMCSLDAVLSDTKIDHEERLRAFWMIEMLDSIFALGLPSYPPTTAAPLGAILPCSDTAWALQDHFGECVPFHDLQYSSGFSMCISLCTVELAPVHQFQHSVIQTGAMAGGPEWQSAAQRLDERLTIWREEFVAAVFRLINAECPHDARAEMRPAVITLLQSQTSLPEGVGQETEPWPYANHRCMYACENMAAKIRRMEESELESCSPCLVLPIFAAARFYIAVAEHRTPALQSALPIEFYDLRYAVAEICHLLQRWVDRYSSPVLRSV